MASVFPHSVTAVMSRRQRMLSEEAHSSVAAMERQDSNQSTVSVQSNGSGRGISMERSMSESSSEQQNQVRPRLVDWFQPVRRMLVRLAP